MRRDETSPLILAPHQGKPALGGQHLVRHMTNQYDTDDLRILNIQEVTPPIQLHEAFPVTAQRRRAPSSPPARRSMTS
jgi:hypothetical protein